VRRESFLSKKAVLNEQRNVVIYLVRLSMRKETGRDLQAICHSQTNQGHQRNKKTEKRIFEDGKLRSLA